jgi:hypothetical protein
MCFEGLPGSFISILCGGALPCLVEISGVAMEVLEEVEPSEILQVTRWRM